MAWAKRRARPSRVHTRAKVARGKEARAAARGVAAGAEAGVLAASRPPLLKCHQATLALGRDHVMQRHVCPFPNPLQPTPHLSISFCTGAVPEAPPGVELRGAGGGILGGSMDDDEDEAEESDVDRDARDVEDAAGGRVRRGAAWAVLVGDARFRQRGHGRR
jgi:hypothetical protein